MKPAGDDIDNFLNRVVPFVATDGARNSRKMALELGIPYQTIRYRMNRLKNQGISIRPYVDPGRLGLARYRVIFDLSDEVKETYPFFGGLHQAAGLHYFARSMVSHKFDTEFLIPRGKDEELRKLLDGLREMSFLQNLVIREIQWKDILMMKTNYYDYVNGEWDVDFSRLKANAIGESVASSSTDTHFDHLDLLIIKSLQLDSQVKSIDLAKMLKRSDRDIAYHLNGHVFRRNLVPSFKLEWIGTKDAWAKHTIIFMTYVFENLPDELLRHAMSIFTSVPFTWNHMRTTENGYLAELLVPIGNLAETMKYLSDNLRRLKIKPDEVLYPDWSSTANYTIPYHMHEETTGWQFEAERGLSLVLQMIKSYES